MSETVEALSREDQAWLARLEQHALRRLRRLGDDLQLSHAEADLERVQVLLDDRAFEAKGSDDLPAFGVVLGNVFHARTAMRWAVITNEFGRNLAVHDPAAGFTLYPIQVLAKRVREGREVRVPDLYQSFVRDLGSGG